MYKCEKCGKEVFEKFGSGRFCSKSCANSRVHSEETKRKISESVRKYSHSLARTIKNEAKKICPICGKSIGVRGFRVHVVAHNRPAVVDHCILNISKRELDVYRETHTRCEICGREETAYDPKAGRARKLAADHQHGTANFRGVLCVRCNQSLGWFESNKDTVLKYLQDRNI